MSNFFFAAVWVSSGQSGTMCTLTVNALNLQGITGQASAQYRIQ